MHLARHGRIAFGAEIEIRQGEEIGRPSLLLARAVGSPERMERVEVAGCAVILAVGELLRASSRIARPDASAGASAPARALAVRTRPRVPGRVRRAPAIIVAPRILLICMGGTS